MMLIYTVINITLAARIARLFHLGERIALQGAVTRAVRSSFLLALPVGLAILLAREPLLDLFGPGFEESSALLLILVPAVLFNIFTGASGAALMMTDHPRPALAARAVGFVVNVTLCVILIPESGATGAAVAMAADILVANSIMAVMAAKYLRLNTTMVPSFLFGRGS
jgi:O-antigen/teichoic acid export membrane protein